MLLKISQNLQENTRAQSLFFNKVAGLRPATFLKTENPAWLSSYQFSEFLSFFIQQIFEWFLFCFVFEKTSSSIPMLLVMLLAHVAKHSNNHSQMFSKTGVFKNFAIFTGKNLCSSHFLVKFQAWRPAFYLKRDSNAGVFLFFFFFCEIFKNSLFIEDLFIISFQNLIVDNWYFRLIFYYRKIRWRNRKNFAIARSKFVFRYLVIFLLQRFVSIKIE